MSKLRFAAACIVTLAVVYALSAAPIDPKIVEIGRWPYGPASSVARDGDLIYFGSGSTLQVWRFNPPDALEIVSELGLADPAREIAIDGDTLVIAVGNRGLQIVDIGDPASPTVIGSIRTRGFANAVAVSNGFVWVAAWRSGIRAFNITDPDRPHLVGVVLPAVETTGVTIDGGYLWATSNSGLHAIDITDPTRPRVVSTTKPGGLNNVTIIDTMAYAAGTWGGLVVFDVADPLHPVKLNQFQQWEYPTSDVAVDGSIAYLACWGYLSVIDVSDPSRLVQIGVVPEIGDSEGRTLAAGGSWLVAADGANGLRIVDVSDPTQPEIVITHEVPGYIDSMAVFGDTILVGATPDQEGGLRSIDISSAEDPIMAGGPAGPPLARYDDMTVIDDHAYVADLSRGIHIFDVHELNHPVFIRTHDEPGTSPERVASTNGLLLVASGYGGLEIFDVSQPTSPVEIGRLDLPDSVDDVAASGDIAYLTGFDLGLVVVDLVDPTAPRVVSELPGFRGKRIAVEGSMIYVAAGYDGLVVIDVAIPLAPTEVGRFDPGWTDEVTVQGHRVVISTWEREECDYRARILDAGNPAKLVERGFYCAREPRLAMTRDLLALTDPTGGLRLLNIDECLDPNPNDPPSPRSEVE